MKTNSEFIRCVLPVCALFLGTPFLATVVRSAQTGDRSTAKDQRSEAHSLDAKESLSLLDAHLDTLAERCENLANDRERDAALRRVKALRERRGELAVDFRPARFAKLLNEVKTEWRKVTS